MSQAGTTTSSGGGGGGETTPIGALMYFAQTASGGTYPNPNWIACDGSIYLQSTYTTLFARMGLINGPLYDWNVVNSPTSSQLASVLGAVFITAGNGGNLYSSTDALTWTAQTSGTSSTIRALAYGASTYVYGGNGGVIATSADAATWTARTSGTTSSVFALTFGASIFVYGGVGGVVSTSTDGITWTARTSGTSSNIFALRYLNGLFVYGGNGGVLATSTDAITWTARTSGTSSAIQSLAYGGGLYLYGGTNGCYATSTDAITWTTRTTPITGLSVPITALEYATTVTNSQYLFGTSSTASLNTALYVSTDAINWVPRTTTTGSTMGFVSSFTVGPSFVLATSTVAPKTFISSLSYPYNYLTQFQVPTENAGITAVDAAGVPITNETPSNFHRKLFIKAL